ncbi:MAG: metallophosphoesterase [Bacilli bacterium]|nr:metallophosphoesterase [Bacilli bacterium]
MKLNELNELINEGALKKHRGCVLFFDNLSPSIGLTKSLIKKNYYIQSVETPSNYLNIDDLTTPIEMLANHIDDLGVLFIANDKMKFYHFKDPKEINTFFRILKWNKEPLDKIKKKFDKNKVKNFSFIQLSDLHFGTEDAVNNIETLKKSLEDRVHNLDEVQFLITGDLVNEAKEEFVAESDDFKAYLVKLSRNSVYFVYGNHDVGGGIFGGVTLSKKNRKLVELMGSFPDIRVIENKKIILILLNSVAGEILAKGEIGKRQFTALEKSYRTISESINNIDDYTKIVLLHHHIIPITKPEEYKKSWKDKVQGDSTMRLVDAEMMIKWINDHHVDFVLHGHKHIPFIKEEENYNIISCGASLGQDSPYLNYNVISINKPKSTCLQYLVKGKKYTELNIYRLNNK